jgi:hypothetical protein
VQVTQTLSPTAGNFFYSIALGQTFTYSAGQVATCAVSNGIVQNAAGSFAYGCNPYYSTTHFSGPPKLDSIVTYAGGNQGSTVNFNVMICINNGGVIH